MLYENFAAEAPTMTEAGGSARIASTTCAPLLYVGLQVSPIAGSSTPSSSFEHGSTGKGR